MKATITIGISASGKNTWACKQDTVIVCRDAIREAFLAIDGIDVETENIRKHWKFGKRENEVTAQYWHIVGQMADRKKDIILCDTNLNADRRKEMQKRLEGLGYTVEYKQFDITYEEAVKRDRNRKNTVGEAVIYKQWLQLYGETYRPPVDAPKAIIVDVDGTLAHTDGKRGPFEWDKVSGDSCDEVVKRIVESFAEDHYIIVLSGRDECCFDLTRVWLVENNIWHDGLFMRPSGDMRKDYIVKRELFDKHIRDDYNVVAVIDDRPQVCREWHRLGLKVIAVGDQNIEF